MQRFRDNFYNDAQEHYCYEYNKVGHVKYYMWEFRRVMNHCGFKLYIYIPIMDLYHI